jgi:3-hydroxyacyl-[acyl-carrier-protein] dehydratase
MLLENLYHIVRQEIGEQTITVDIALHTTHAIFEGHFPGQPILPGVCQTQICVELFNELTQQNLVLTGASVMKFLSFINPNVHPNLTFKLDWANQENGVVLNAVISAEGTVFLKFKGDLRTEY